MGKVIDLTGRTFGRWSVSGFSHQVGKMYYWDCICECGTKRAVFGGDLKRNGSLSCGCLAREMKREGATTHGMVDHPAYRSWVGLRSRCHGHNNTMRHLYGGRGITVCQRWDSFEAFWEDMGPTWIAGLSIDRKDSNGNYEPDNCKWSTDAEQAANRRTSRIIDTPNGKMTVSEAARQFGFPIATLHARIRYGWDDKDLLKPAQKTTRVYPKRTEA